LIGRPFVQETINAAMQAMLDDYTPMSDMRASANYRMQVAQNLLQRFYLEHSDVNYPVRLEGNEHA
jgi:xanthine dehydrogenase small subunit